LRKATSKEQSANWRWQTDVTPYGATIEEEAGGVVVVTAIRPTRGGFLRPFGCGWFIREFLLGHGPEGAPVIDPNRGAPQADINYEYKSALIRAFARDAAERRIEEIGVPLVSPERAEEIYQEELKKIPHKYTRMRYHSFGIYFSMLKRLGWVELTGETETSTVQEPKRGVVNPRGQPRIYYRLTAAGRAAPFTAIMNPLRVLYPTFDARYFRAKRKAKHYTRAKA